MLRVITVCAVACVSLAGAAQASTFTLNTSNAYCVTTLGATCTDLAGTNVDIANDLSAGSVYGMTDPGFLDGNGNSYAIKATVLGVGGPAGSSHSSINVFQNNAWVHYKFEFVESFDIDNRTFGNLTTIGNIARVELQDIDSNGRQDFTDVGGMGFSTPVTATVGSDLVNSGFTSTTPNAPTPSFDLYRLSQNGDGNWFNEGNVPSNANQAAKEAVSVVYNVGGPLTGFELVWGSTGKDRANVRGWNLAIEAEPAEVSPVPLPAAAWMLIAALGGLCAMGRRKTTS